VKRPRRQAVGPDAPAKPVLNPDAPPITGEPRTQPSIKAETTAS